MHYSGTAIKNKFKTILRRHGLLVKTGCRKYMFALMLMQTDTTYSEDLLGFKFKPAKGCMVETAKSVVRLGLV